MTRSDRVQVTVTPEMTIALDLLAARTGHTRSAQASLMLRQALARTIATQAVQDVYRRHVAGRNVATWRSDQATERVIDGDYARLMEVTEDAAREIERGVPPKGPARTTLESAYKGGLR